MSEWQPIETAPRDGTRVLLYFPWRGDRSIAYWDAYYAEGGRGHEARYGEAGAWIEPVSGERLVLHYDPPSAWQQPPPPQNRGSNLNKPTEHSSGCAVYDITRPELGECSCGVDPVTPPADRAGG